MNEILHNLFQELISYKIPATIVNLNPFTIRIEGFYKNGNIDIFVENDQYFFKTRYEVERIGDYVAFYEVVALNFREWIKYRNKFEDWKNPESVFIPHLIGMGFIEKKIITTYVEKK